MVDPAAESRRPARTTPVLSFKTSSIFISLFFRFCRIENWVFLSPEEGTKLPPLRETERERDWRGLLSSKAGLRNGGLQVPCPAGGGGCWWSIGCVQKEWLAWEMFRLNHAFGIGKPCLKSTGKNEAEFMMWCLKILTFAKGLSNPWDLLWKRNCALSHSKSSRDGKGQPLAFLLCCLDQDVSLAGPLLAHCPKPEDQQNYRPNFRPTWGVGVWWRASTYMCLSLFCCLRRCCLSWQIDLLKAKLVTGEITDFT